MTTSSARPDQLRGFAVDLRRRVDSTAADVDALARSVARYRSGCGAAAPLDGIDWIARNRLDRARSLATSVSQIAQAFRGADGSGSPIATAGSVALGDLIIDRWPALATDALLEPRRDRAEHGRAVGDALRTLTATDDWAGLTQLLGELSPVLVADPAFAAALFGALDGQTVIELVDLLAGAGAGLPANSGLGLIQLSRLHNSATHAGAGPGPNGLDADLLGELVSTRSGRNALRLLLTTAPAAPAPEALGELLAPLLLDHDAEGDALPTATSIAVHGTGPGADGDAALLALVSTMPDVALALINAPLSGHRRAGRFSELYGPANGQAQDALAGALDAALHHPDLRGPGNSLARAQVMNDVTAQVSGGPTAVRAPLATVLADTVFEDTAYWATRARRGTADAQGEITSVFEAISRHDRSFVTLAAGLEVKQRAHLSEAVAGRTTDLGALDDLDAISKRLQDGAEQADRPGDPWGWAFAVADKGLDVAQMAVPGAKAAKTVLRPVVDAGLEYGHERSRPDQGTRGSDVERQRVRRRANAWAAIAEDPVMGRRLVTDAGGASLDLGDLRALGTDPDALSELAIWEAAQPADLHALADRLAGPA